jgi:hypothetical protein
MADKKLLTSLAIAFSSVATYTAIQVYSPEVGARPLDVALVDVRGHLALASSAPVRRGPVHVCLSEVPRP